jgi:hypothetical protein
MATHGQGVIIKSLRYHRNRNKNTWFKGQQNDNYVVEGNRGPGRRLDGAESNKRKLGKRDLNLPKTKRETKVPS